MRVLDPPKLVVVRRDDTWHDGELRAWRRDADGWLGFVCYAESAGLRWLEWVAAERVRQPHRTYIARNPAFLAENGL
jgi:hypothetical protein